MKSQEMRERIIVALMVEAESKGLDAFLDPASVADAFNIDRKVGQLRLIVDDLSNRGLVRNTQTMGGGDEGGLMLRLTNRGVEAAEEILEAHPEYGQPIIPAAGRYVTLSDNQRGNIHGDLETLKAQVEATNDASEEDRQIALSEIAAFETTIIQPRISAELIDRFVARVLKWMVKVFGEAMVKVVTEALIARLTGLGG